MAFHVYLAGPDVFFPNATKIAEVKKEICAKHGIVGLDPIDNNVDCSKPPEIVAKTIEASNCHLMNRADAIIANLSPFRGPSADVGTASECGYMRASNKPAVGYAVLEPPHGEQYKERLDHVTSGALLLDRNDYSLVENFGLYDNLMISVPLLHFTTRYKRRSNDRQAWQSAFEECVVFLAGFAASIRHRAQPVV